MTNYYIEKNGKIITANTDKTAIENTLIFCPDLQGLEIKETERPIVQLDDTSFVFGDTDEYQQEQTEKRQAVFNQEFFLTSLGYIRRQVNMATGEKKDFLSDLLPTISMAVQLGQEVPIITYKTPDFTKEFTLEYMESLQEVKNVTTEFVQECALQVSKDFMPTPLVVVEG